LLAAARGLLKQTARVGGSAERLREEIGAPKPPHAREEYDREIAAARATLGEEAFAAAWGGGRGMTLEQAVAYALEEATTPL
jgi:hypothetical protein